jgi:hypothetical protein
MAIAVDLKPDSEPQIFKQSGFWLLMERLTRNDAPVMVNSSIPVVVYTEL